MLTHVAVREHDWREVEVRHMILLQVDVRKSWRSPLNRGGSGGLSPNQDVHGVGGGSARCHAKGRERGWSDGEGTGGTRFGCARVVSVKWAGGVCVFRAENGELSCALASSSSECAAPG